MVSGSFSLRYSRFFSPFPHGTGSLSVSQEYLALPDGPGRFRQGSTCPALLRMSLWFIISYLYKTFTSYGATFQLLLIQYNNQHWVLQPPYCRNNIGLGYSNFARHYSRNHFCFLLLRLLRCFSSAGSPPLKDTAPSMQWVAPFGYLRIYSYVPIPAAFRSLSRPSSPLRA